MKLADQPTVPPGGGRPLALMLSIALGVALLAAAVLVLVAGRI